MDIRKEPAMATTPESFVDALNAAFGKQTTQRSAHAKGVVLLGKFATTSTRRFASSDSTETATPLRKASEAASSMRVCC